MDSDQNTTKKKFYFYYKGTEQRLTVYEGTTQDEIKHTIKDLFAIENEKQIIFMDDDGDPIVISSFIPDKTKIFIQEGDIITSKIQTQTIQNEPKPWTWKQDISKANFINANTFQTYKEDSAIVYGDIKIDSGIHYWKIKISQIWCCHNSGITVCQFNGDNFCTYHDNGPKHALGLPGKIPGEKSGPADTGCADLNLKDMTLGYYVDITKKLFILVNETTNSIYTKETISFMPVIPFFAARKHEATVSLENSFALVPEWLKDYI
jgi:hypothetical protein